MPISSPLLQSVGYDPSTQVLEVAFHSGFVFQYIGVPAAIYHALVAAPSPDQYLDEVVRPAGFGYLRCAEPAGPLSRAELPPAPRVRGAA